MQKVYGILVFILFFSCSYQQQGEHEQITREQQIEELKTELVNLFQETLKNNYGRADEQAILWLMKGYHTYSPENYIIEVNRNNIKQFNEKYYPLLCSYFFDQNAMLQKRIELQGYDTPCSINVYGSLGNVFFRMDEDLYLYYLQKEVIFSEHPFLKEIAWLHGILGNETGTPILETIDYYAKEKKLDFETDIKVQTYVAVVFLEYLYYCANMDIVTGKDKTETFIKDVN